MKYVKNFWIIMAFIMLLFVGALQTPFLDTHALAVTASPPATAEPSGIVMPTPKPTPKKTPAPAPVLPKGRFRALAVGNTEYKDGDVLGCDNDVVLIMDALVHGGYPEKNIELLVNASATQMEEGIKTAFKGAKEGDVSFFYFSGKGYRNKKGVVSLMGTDGSYFGMGALKKQLEQIPGTVIVVLDTSYAGAFITREEAEKASAGFCEGALLAFEQRGRASRKALDGGKFKVLASCAEDEAARMIFLEGINGYVSLFTAYVYVGSMDKGVPADANKDKLITFHEMANYVVPLCKKKAMTVGFFPQEENMVLLNRR